jgi:hypothetical protein
MMIIKKNAIFFLLHLMRVEEEKNFPNARAVLEEPLIITKARNECLFVLRNHDHNLPHSPLEIGYGLAVQARVGLGVGWSVGYSEWGRNHSPKLRDYGNERREPEIQQFRGGLIGFPFPLAGIRILFYFIFIFLYFDSSLLDIRLRISKLIVFLFSFLAARGLSCFPLSDVESN